MILKSFLICSLLTRHWLIEHCHLSNLLQMPNYHRMVDAEFFGNFSCSYKSISFNAFSQSVTVNFWWPATLFLIFKALVSLQNYLNHHCTVHLLPIPGPNALLMLQVVSAALHPILNLNKKISRICFLSNIVSVV